MATKPPDDCPIFVFGSNLRGIHGAGAARWARENRGVIPGQAEGLQGRSYAIPTCYRPGIPLLLERIQEGAEKFKEFAAAHPEEKFQLTPVGTGHAGYKHYQIAPLFFGCPGNVAIPEEWATIIDI